MKIASVQLQARGVWEYRQALEDILRQIGAAATQGAELIVLPECAYPAYFLELDLEAAEEALGKTYEVLEAVAAQARKLHVHVVLGVALPEDGKLYNAAVLIDDEGKILHRAYKSNLWHFDDRTFTPGEDFQTVDTKLGRLGMMVCADGRIPEIARILALQGAKLIVDVVNLVASARSPKDLMNQQYAFMLPVRAMENRVWLVTADKCGMEGGCAVYLGRSIVVSPEGAIVAECPPDREEILFYDVDLEMAKGPEPYSPPEECAVLCRSTETLPIAKKMKADLGPVSTGERLTAVVQFRANSLAEYLEKAKWYLRGGQLSYCRCIVLPPYDGEADVMALCAQLQEAIEEAGVVAFTACLEGGALRAAAVATERIWALGEDGVVLHVEEIDGLGYCVLTDAEPYIPELPRSAMLLGCEVLIWMDRRTRTMDQKVAQTRAAENKMFVIRASSTQQDASYVVTPGGTLACTTFQGAEQLTSALILRSDGLSKTVYPGTDVVVSRKPNAYKELIR